MNYEGKGDLSKAIFDLASHVSIGSFDLDYDGQHYIGSKKLSADLVTKINTSSLAFAFEKNDLKLNNLPVDFTGRFEFWNMVITWTLKFILQKETSTISLLHCLPVT